MKNSLLESVKDKWSRLSNVAKSESLGGEHEPA